MKYPLCPGTYAFSVGVANKGFDIGSFEEYLLQIHDIELLKVLSNDGILYSGIFNINPSVEILYKSPDPALI